MKKKITFFKKNEILSIVVFSSKYKHLGKMSKNPLLNL